MTKDEQYMQRCIELARKGSGFVAPNPQVGCVIVKNGKVIAEGWHKEYGAAHAERNAINSAVRKGYTLTGSELYVNLEPCAHYGNTPPCAELIVKHRFKRVVVGIKDPYHKVAGKGIKLMKKAGIEVKVNVLKAECLELNKFFIKYVTTGLPYVMLKAAQTLDGKIADSKFRSKWISSPESRKLVHEFRASYDAVLVGKNTVKYDDPALTVRDVKGRDPLRVVMDPMLTLGTDRKIFKAGRANQTIVLCSPAAPKSRIAKLLKLGAGVLEVPLKSGVIDADFALRKLSTLGITSVMIEGGAFTYERFIKKGLVDEYMIFVAPKLMGGGIDAFGRNFNPFEQSRVSYYQSGPDLLINIRK